MATAINEQQAPGNLTHELIRAALVNQPKNVITGNNIYDILYFNGLVDLWHPDNGIRMGCFDLVYKGFRVHPGRNGREKIILMMGNDHFRGERHDVTVANSGDTGMPLHGDQEDVKRWLPEFFQFNRRGTAAAKVMKNFPFETDAPAEYLTFGVVAQQRQIPGQAKVHSAEGLDHQPPVEADVPTEKGLDVQVVEMKCFTIGFHAADPVRGQSAGSLAGREIRAPVRRSSWSSQGSIPARHVFCHDSQFPAVNGSKMPVALALPHPPTRL